MDTAAEAPRWLEYRPVEDLPDAMDNPKGHAGAELEASINRFGFAGAVELDERTGRLVAGHGRKEQVIARRDAGADPPDGIVVNGDGTWLVPVVRGWSSADDDEARAYVIATNRTTEVGGWLPAVLAPQLDALRASPGGLAGIGYDGDGVDALLSEVGLLGLQRGSFLDDLAGDGRPGNPMTSTTVIDTDLVELRLPMTEAERDEVVSALRVRQVTDRVDTLTGALLAIVRAS